MTLDLQEIKHRHSFIERRFGYPANLDLSIKRLMKEDLPSLLTEVEELRKELGSERRLRIAWENQFMTRGRN